MANLTLLIVGFCAAIGIIYAIAGLKKREFLDVNHISYFALGLFTTISGITFLLYLILTAFDSLFNMGINTFLEKEGLTNINNFLIPILIGGLIIIVMGLKQIKTVLQKEIKEQN